VWDEPQARAKISKINASHAAGLTAIAAMVGSTLCYLLGDTAVKLAAEAVSVPQIIVIRGALTALLVTLAAAAAGVLRYWRGMFSRPVLVRGVFDAATTLMFTNALANMRIADATAVINAAPIAGTLPAVRTTNIGQRRTKLPSDRPAARDRSRSMASRHCLCGRRDFIGRGLSMSGQAGLRIRSLFLSVGDFCKYIRFVQFPKGKDFGI
jgi:hypothetical protein